MCTAYSAANEIWLWLCWTKSWFSCISSSLCICACMWCIKGSFCVCTQPMRNGVSMQHCLSLAGCIYKMIPVYYNPYSSVLHHWHWANACPLPTKNVCEQLPNAPTRQNTIKSYVKRMQNSHDVLYTRNTKSKDLWSLSISLLDDDLLD